MEVNSIEFILAVIVPAIAIVLVAFALYYKFYLISDSDKKKI